MEISYVLRAIASLIFVIGLMFGCLGIYKKFFMGKGIAINKDRRMNIVETLYLDRARKLVIVKKDGDEVTILLGQNTETVIK